MMFPLVNYALEQVVGENRQETLFDERRLTRDASTANCCCRWAMSCSTKATSS